MKNLEENNMKRRVFIKGLCVSLLPNSLFANKRNEKTMQQALILIDFQNDYFDGGALPLNGMIPVLNNANFLIKYAQENNLKIYTIQHISTRKGATFFLPDTKGVGLHDNLNSNNTTIIKKKYPNSFRETILQDELKKHNISELLVCGAMTHMCIDTTVRAGFDLGYKITLAYDACATKDLQFKDNIIKAKDVQDSFISALGSIFCEVKSTREIAKT